METLKKILVYLIGVLLATLGTLLFMAFHASTYGAYSCAEWWQVLVHSLPQHLTVMGYVMALPLLLGLVRLWQPRRRRFTSPSLRPDWHTCFMMGYMALMAVLLVTGWMVNVVLYGYWGIVLDGTALFYLLDNPADALAESPLWAVLLLAVLLVLVAWWVAVTMRRLFLPSQVRACQGRTGRGWRTLLLVLLCGLDFLAIRGGWTPATMNPGRAYFSDAMPLNHAAVDPVFNFLYSVGKNQRFDKQYRFMPAEEVLTALQELEQATRGGRVLAGESGSSATSVKGRVQAQDRGPQTTREGDSVVPLALQLLRSQRPNILLIVLESFSGTACHRLTPEADPDWMPSVNRALDEGVAFTRFYANSFRTDRGMAAIMAAYPGQPTNSVMKDQAKCDNLQYLSKRLGEAGYDLQFIHGGDVNFTNMQGFLRSGGITNIVGDTDFPVSERLDKWGVRDDQMFDYLYEQVTQSSSSTNAPSAPWFKAFLTLSSHEPFEVPFHHFDDPYLNSVAYADSCLGSFIERVKAEPAVWDNLLIIGLPDHCYARHPSDIQQHEPRRYHIPMFWTGGAVKGPAEVTALGQQTDLAATLLGQMGIAHEDFNFSKDMLDPSQPHFAFYAFSDGFGLITDSCQYVQDNKNPGTGLQPGTHDPDGQSQRWGQAYLQHLYDDLQTR